ncbi:MAG: 2OG-Fe(II) oxygenase [Rickettsia sp.]|nr:2OG-Fe(II) oxygenase [Rickettsia sp.]
MTRISQTNLPYRFSQSQMKEFALLASNKIIDAKNNGMYYLEPFKHLVIDNFLHADLAQSCLDNFPSPNEDIWDRSYDENIEIKQRTIWKSEFDIPEAIVDTIRLLNSSIFLLALSETFNIKKLVPDPYFTGGGLNVTMPNGLLDVHVDGNYHDATGLNRRMNVIIYLNPKWQEGWGGEFGIYNNNGENCLKKLAPLFNRLVAFDTHDKSYHGLPDPCKFPEGEYRKSIILYYYTKAPRESINNIIDKPHRALWKKRNFTDKDGNIIREYS